MISLSLHWSTSLQENADQWIYVGKKRLKSGDPDQIHIFNIYWNIYFARILLQIYTIRFIQIMQFLSRNFATIIMIYTLCAHSPQHTRNTENKAAITLKSLISLYPFIVARAQLRNMINPARVSGYHSWPG